MFWHDDFLYFFIKGFGGDTITASYRIPDVVGNYEAEFLEFLVNPNYSPSITGADISPDGETIALLAYQKCVLVKCFDAPYFLNGSNNQAENYMIEFDGPQAINTNFRSEAVLFKDNLNCIGTSEFTNNVNVVLDPSVFKFNIENSIANNFTCLEDSCGLIANANFGNGLNNWQTYIDNSTINASIETENNKAKITMQDGGNNSWQVRLKQEYFSTKIASTYQVSFYASANFARTIDVLVGEKINGIYKGYLFRTVTLDIDENYYEFYFTSTEPNNDFTRISFDCGDALNSEVYIENVCIEEDFCPNYAFVTDTINTAHYKAANVFESRGIVQQNAQVKFTASNFVNLKNDFEVPINANFEALIEVCD